MPVVHDVIVYRKGEKKPEHLWRLPGGNGDRGPNGEDIAQLLARDPTVQCFKVKKTVLPNTE